MELELVLDMSADRLSSSLAISSYGDSTYMDVERTGVLSKLLLLLQSNVFEILISEDNDSSLGNHQSQFILLLNTQLRQLPSKDFTPDS
ncbi:hypothetical protein HJFPF1_02336 [Paramyrothecium foliicola]|nr:hypothetical protein HJFPF1_02336 [Paramyrothecium foliicola]